MRTSKKNHCDYSGSFFKILEDYDRLEGFMDVTSAEKGIFAD